MTRAKDISKILTDADISGNIDVDGVTNLDVTDIDGTLNVQGETTLQTHLNMGDGDIIKLGDSADLLIYHDGNSRITDVGGGKLQLETDGTDIALQKGATEYMARFFTDGAVELYHDNSKKFETTSSGVIVNNKLQGASGESLTVESQSGGAVIINTNGANERVRVTSAGSVAIGTSSADGLLTISGDTNPLIRVNHTQNADEIMMIMQHAGAIASGFTTMIQFRDHDGDERGTIKTNGSSTQFNTSSDYRLKENINYDFDATSRLKQLKPARFNFIKVADTTVDGFLAHEVSSIVPEAISGEKDAMTKEVLYVDGDDIPDGKKVGDVKEASKIAPQGIDQSKLVPLLVKTIQELEARITTLESA